MKVLLNLQTAGYLAVVALGSAVNSRASATFANSPHSFPGKHGVGFSNLAVQDISSLLLAAAFWPLKKNMRLMCCPGTCQFNFLNENIFLNPLAGSRLVNISLQYDTNTGCAFLVGRHDKLKSWVQQNAVIEFQLKNKIK